MNVINEINRKGQVNKVFWVKIPTDSTTSTTSGQTDTTSGQTITNGQTSSISGQTSTTSGQMSTTSWQASTTSGQGSTTSDQTSCLITMSNKIGECNGTRTYDHLVGERKLKPNWSF